MINLLNLKLSKNKKLVFYLNQIQGVGKKSSLILLNDLCFGNDIRFKDLNQTKNILILQWLENSNFTLEKNK